MNSAAKSAEGEPSLGEVQEALAIIARHGVGALWGGEVDVLLELPAVSGLAMGQSEDVGRNAVQTLLRDSVEKVTPVPYRDVLKVVLGLDPATKGMSARERRELAGKRFRGDRPVKAGTIRTYHEPRALDKLAEVLVASETRAAPILARPRRQTPVFSFGDPDAARADSAAVLDEFVPVNFAGGGRIGDPGTMFEDLRVRVIAGRKGSGKTLYLRQLNLAAKKDPSLYVDAVSTWAPATARVVALGMWYPRSFLVEKWKQLWRAAALRSVLSHITLVPRLSSLLDTPALDDLRHAYESMGGMATTPRSIGAELSDLLFQHNTRASLESFLAGIAPDAAEYLLAQHLNQLPPLFFYVDALDEEFTHAPYYWLSCQKGLFYETLRLLRDARLGGRLHIHIAVRDVVYASAMQSEHATRYAESAHIVNLRWPSALAQRFLNAKVRRLAPQVLLQSAPEPSVADWLGREMIEDPIRGREVPIAEYLIGYTRALPRDVVTLGNLLCREVIAAGEAGRWLSDEAIRAAVNRAAHIFGTEQLAITANEAMSHLMPANLGRYDQFFEENWNADTPYTESTRARLEAILAPYASAGGSLGREDLADIDRVFSEEFELDLSPILWENDLLGVESEEGRVSYRYDTATDDLEIPRSARSFDLHPVLRVVCR